MPCVCFYKLPPLPPARGGRGGTKLKHRTAQASQAQRLCLCLVITWAFWASNWHLAPRCWPGQPGPQSLSNSMFPSPCPPQRRQNGRAVLYICATASRSPLCFCFPEVHVEGASASDSMCACYLSSLMFETKSFFSI